MNIEMQIKKLYAFDAALCLRITDAVWVLFLLNRGFSLAQVGMAEGVYHVISMFCEVPSGMAADLFGRKRTLVFSGLLGMVSSLFMCLDAGFLGVCAGMAFSALSLNLMSGTEEAILYDSLLSAGEEERFGKTLARLSMIGRVGSALGCLASPMAVALGYKGTYLFSTCLYFISAVTAAGVAEPIVTERQRKRQEHPLQGIGKRFRQHIGESAQFIRSHPKVICKLFANGAIGCPVYLTVMFLQEHLTALGWPAAWIGVPLLVMRLFGTVGVWLGSREGKSRNKGKKGNRIQAKGAAGCKNEGRQQGKMGLAKCLTVCGLVSGVGALMAGSPWITVIVPGAMLLQASEGFAQIRVDENVNRDFESDQRATMVSIDSMLYSVLMIAVSPAVGKLGDWYGTWAGFTLLGTALAAGSLGMGALYSLYQRKSLGNEVKGNCEKNI